MVASATARAVCSGAVAMKKLALTDKGKGWAGVTVRDPELVAMAERIVAATAWRGPFEVEAMRDESGRYHLIEINPRFPAWVHLATQAGVNLPRAVVELARGAAPPKAAATTRRARCSSASPRDQIVEHRRVRTHRDERRDPPRSAARERRRPSPPPTEADRKKPAAKERTIVSSKAVYERPGIIRHQRAG